MCSMNDDPTMHDAPRHEATGPEIRDGKVVCSTCGEPARVETGDDMDSAWVEHD